jgi:ABC-type polysaccharide/polyol phosphate transport system ATPase subunit
MSASGHDFAIRSEALSKRFAGDGHSGQEPVTALRGLSMSILPGETVALIGSNGSGKSTLLSILSGIVRPTEGTVHVNGRVVSILDVGGNFLPDLTGAQNAKMFLTMNGMEERKAILLLDDIRSFSELGAQFDHPLKAYSNGMYLRLAFAAAFFLDAEIYLIDEVINVGDQAFRLKIDLFFKKLREAGKTLLIASHDANAVLSMCSRCLWLEQGQQVMDDRPSKVIIEYTKFQELRFQKSIAQTDLEIFDDAIMPSEGEDFLHHHFDGEAFRSEALQLLEVEIAGTQRPHIFRQDPITVKIVIDKQHTGAVVPQIKVRNEFNQPVFFSVSVQGEGAQLAAESGRRRGIMEFRCTIPANWLSSGRYFLSLNFGRDVDVNQPVYNERAFNLPNELCFHVRSREQEFISDPVHYSFNPELKWEVMGEK